MNPLKLLCLTLLFVVAAFFSIDVTMSLAGRQTAIVKYFPFMSLLGALLVVIAVCFCLAYVLWEIARARKWRWFASFAIGALLLLVGCVYLFMTMSEESANEAREIVTDYLATPRKYAVSYSGEVNEASVRVLDRSRVSIERMYSSHAYGRYVFRVRSSGRDEFYIQLNKDIAETRLFVYGAKEYSGPRG